MATIRQYFETDFDYALRVKIKCKAGEEPCEGAILCDPNAKATFLAFYLPGNSRNKESFREFLSGLNYGETSVDLDGGVVLMRTRQFIGGKLRFAKSDCLAIEYQLLGDPSWRDLLRMPATRRVFVYAEANLSEAEVRQLQSESEALGHDLQFRADAYVNGRSQAEAPQAFISYDSRDKGIARAMAMNLQRRMCPVWYDEFSLRLGDNLRQSIEKGLRECKKCVLVLSTNFFDNKGWGKKEFESIFTREIVEEKLLVLPIWCGVTKEQVYEYSTSLLNVKGIDWGTLGEDEVCRQICAAVSSD